MKEVAYLKKSTNSSKKYMVTIISPYGKTKTVHFGANGYFDYTIHKDKERMKRYDARHKSRENWTKSGIYTAGFWSKWILWSKPSLSQAITYTSEKFGIKIKKGSPREIPKTVIRSRKKRSYKKSPNRYSPKKLLF
jgi:hypothetical protein